MEMPVRLRAGNGCGSDAASIGKDKELRLPPLHSLQRQPGSDRGNLRHKAEGYKKRTYFNKKRKLWIAQITFQGKTRYLGAFGRLMDAVKARQRGDEIYDKFLEQVEVTDSE